MVAACFGGMRWCLTQALFAHDSACAHDPVVVVYHVSPAGVLTLLPIALVLELNRLRYWASTVDPWCLGEAFVFATCAGAIAYVMLLVEVRLLHETSSLSLSVAGALKDVSQMALAVMTFGDTITAQSAAGLGLVLLASFAFTRTRDGKRSVDAKPRSRRPRGISL